MVAQVKINQLSDVLAYHIDTVRHSLHHSNPHSLCEPASRARDAQKAAEYIFPLILVPRGRAPFGQHKNRDLLTGPISEVRDSRTSRHFPHAQNQVWQIWLVLVSICCVYKVIQTRNVVGPGQRPRFLVLTKRNAASGDENVFHFERRVLKLCGQFIAFIDRIASKEK